MESWRNPAQEEMLETVGNMRLRKGLKDAPQTEACSAPSFWVSHRQGLKEAVRQPAPHSSGGALQTW